MKRIIDPRSGHGMTFPLITLVAATISMPLMFLPMIVTAFLQMLLPLAIQFETGILFCILAIEAISIVGYCGKEFYRTGSGFHAIVIGYVLFSLSLLFVARYVEKI